VRWATRGMGPINPDRDMPTFDWHGTLFLSGNTCWRNIELPETLSFRRFLASAYCHLVESLFLTAQSCEKCFCLVIQRHDVLPVVASSPKLDGPAYYKYEKKSFSILCKRMQYIF